MRERPTPSGRDDASGSFSTPSEHMLDMHRSSAGPLSALGEHDDLRTRTRRREEGGHPPEPEPGGHQAALPFSRSAIQALILSISLAPQERPSRRSNTNLGS